MLRLVGKLFGIIAPLLAVGSTAYLLFGVQYGYQRVTNGIMTTGTTSVWESPDAPVIVFWCLLVVVVALLGAAATRADRINGVWVCGGVTLFVSALGAMSIGWAFAPVALALLSAALLLSINFSLRKLQSSQQ